MIRRYGEPARRDQFYKRRPGVYAILARDGKLLLTFQDAPLPEFQLPGGGIDVGEHPIAALHREVREETGWNIALNRHVGTFRRFTYMPEYNLWAEKVCSVFLGRPIHRLGSPTEAGHTAIWMTVSQALDHLGNDGDKAMLWSIRKSLA